MLQSFASNAFTYLHGLAGDSSGNVYVAGFQSGTSTVTAQRFAIGSNVASATYMGSSTNPRSLGVTASGELVVSYLVTDGDGNTTGYSYDIWDPGASGLPSRTLNYTLASADANYPTNYLAKFALAADGTLYIAHLASNVADFAVDVVPPGTSTPSRTITDSLATSVIYPQALAIGSDGTLYVGAFNYYKQSDPAAGFYVFPPSASEKLVAGTPPGAYGIDFDASGNVYVGSSNLTQFSNTDTEHLLTVYSPQAATMLRQVDDAAPGGILLQVSDDGTAFIAQDSNQFGDASVPTTEDVVVVRPGATSSSVFIAKDAPVSMLVEDNPGASAMGRRRAIQTDLRGWRR